MPRGCEALWDLFASLHATRKRTDNGAFLGIEWAELAGCQAAYGTRLTPWEVDTLRALDGAVMPILNKRKIQQQ